MATAVPGNESLIGTRRTFTASDGVPWSVSEYAEPTSDATEDRYLVFECDGVMRRVRHFPCGWREVGIVALLALSWLRQTPPALRALSVVLGV